MVQQKNSSLNQKPGGSFETTAGDQPLDGKSTQLGEKKRRGVRLKFEKGKGGNRRGTLGLGFASTKGS